jgi:hypothetical protein
MWYSQQELIRTLWEKRANEIFMKLWRQLEEKRKHKFWAEKLELDWIKFASKKEAKRFNELRFLENTGKIRNLMLQVAFLLQEWFEWNGKKIRPIKYIADFVYEDEKGKKIVEDTKGFKTKDYLLKRKLFLKRYKDKIIFLET